jgi:hypothetical protein
MSRRRHLPPLIPHPFDSFDFRRWEQEDERYRAISYVERAIRERAVLAANRWEADQHQAWALTHPDYRDRLHAVHTLDGSAPAAVACFRLPV